MADSFSEFTREGYFSRIGSSIGGVLVGIVLFAVSIFLLGWNEGRAVHRAKALKEGAAAVVSIDSAAANSQNEGKLVHFTGEASGEKLADPILGVSQIAIRLKRDVEMYQWKETENSNTKKDAIGGGTTTEKTYTYDKTWSASAIASANFKHPDGHANPVDRVVSAQEWTAAESKVGAFKLTPELLSKIDNFSPVAISQENISKLPDDIRSRTILSGQTAYVSNTKGITPDASSPQVGDLKVSVSAAPPTTVSVIARQTGSTLENYKTSDGHDLNAMLYLGTHSAADMFKTEMENNATLTWILRLVGFVVMFISINMVLAPLKVMSDLVGFLGSIVGAGIGLVAFLLAASVSLLTIAIAWVVYRPLIGVSLILLAVAAMVFLKKTIGRRAANA